jgi:hypothetical protein
MKSGRGAIQRIIFISSWSRVKYNLVLFLKMIVFSLSLSLSLSLYIYIYISMGRLIGIVVVGNASISSQSISSSITVAYNAHFFNIAQIIFIFFIMLHIKKSTVAARYFNTYLFSDACEAGKGA